MEMLRDWACCLVGEAACCVPTKATTSALRAKLGGSGRLGTEAACAENAEHNEEQQGAKLRDLERSFGLRGGQRCKGRHF